MLHLLGYLTARTRQMVIPEFSEVNDFGDAVEYDPDSL